MTSEEHNWLRAIEGKIDKLAEQLSAANQSNSEHFSAVNKSIADLTAYGCAQAPRHDDHEGRLRMVENNMAENKGKGVVIGAMISGVISIAAVYLGKIFR